MSKPSKNPPEEILHPLPTWRPCSICGGCWWCSVVQTCAQTMRKRRTALAAIAAIVAAASPSACGFPSEGTGELASAEHHRAPRPDGEPIGGDDQGDAASSGGDASSSSSDAAESDGNPTESNASTSSTGETPDAESSDDASSSSTGEPAWPEPHCDASCPEADRIHADDAGTACVCAPACETDDDCTGLALCNSTGVAGEGRCYIECDAPQQCPLDGSAPMQCRYYQGSISACMWDGES